ncbi:hypothetical protein SDC9_38613 [bioreactor metagenome]|uniref:Secretion system C-terminal sorting domain-containing protein n=1 Tax=bioreactor metagenome TaxID=1076179 RepID=A0A644VPP7_9ZZZZ|nr:hypothetical protein [Lentimicrobium sp.]MEA5111997.1 hypothetical protein [Lentimicrobium sp.]
MIFPVKYLMPLVIIALLVLPSAGRAQPHPLLQDFSGYQLGNSVFLRWTFRSGSLCEGVRIERSQDGIIFNEIGEIPGICGNPETSVTFTFTDSLPVPNTRNYYRLELGNTGYTTALEVEFIPAGDQGYTILYSDQGAELSVENPPGRKGEVPILDISGKSIDSYIFDQRRIALTRKPVIKGIYLFMLRYENGAGLSGKFIIP